MGDIVDRGPYSLELLFIIFFLRILNPEQIYIINGNHEDLETFGRYGLLKEVSDQFENFKDGTGKKELLDKLKESHNNMDKFKIFKQLYPTLVNTMYYFPSVIYLQFMGKYYHLSHGAFDKRISDTGKIERFLNDSTSYAMLEKFNTDNQFKWGDFYQHELGYKGDNRGRDHFGTEVTKEYLTKNGIKSIIGGHQDFINLGLLVDPNRIKDEKIMLNGQEFNRNLCKTNMSTISLNYDLLCPNDKIKEKKIINLDPNRDFLALITSTAVITRGMRNNAYLIMEYKQK